MAQITFSMYFLAILALLPLYTLSIDFARRKMPSRSQILADFEKRALIKRQSGASATGVCSAGSYLCPASLSGGCCPNTRACGLTDCPLLPTTTLLSSDSYQCAATAYECPASLNGGCCPTTQACGVTNCPDLRTITSDNLIGTVGTDESTRWCTTGSFLCDADVNYGCCPLGDICGFSKCHPTSTIVGPSTSSTSPVTPFATPTPTISVSPVVASSRPKKLSGGAIGGIAGGVVGGLAIIGASLWAFCLAKRKKKKDAASGQNPPVAPMSPPPIYHQPMGYGGQPQPMGYGGQPQPMGYSQTHPMGYNNQAAYGGGYTHQPEMSPVSPGPSQVDNFGNKAAYGQTFPSAPNMEVTELPSNPSYASEVHGTSAKN